jgi:hypothetical protein
VWSIAESKRWHLLLPSSTYLFERGLYQRTEFKLVVSIVSPPGRALDNPGITSRNEQAHALLHAAHPKLESVEIVIDPGELEIADLSPIANAQRQLNPIGRNAARAPSVFPTPDPARLNGGNMDSNTWSWRGSRCLDCCNNSNVYVIR